MKEYRHSGESMLVSNMAAEAQNMEIFPVLIGNEVTHFHNITGGYNRKRGFPVVNLVHEVQGPRSPYRVDTDQLSHEVEAHLSDNFYHLSVDGIRAVGDYPDEAYKLSLKVSGFEFGPQSFSEALSADADSRWETTKYE